MIKYNESLYVLEDLSVREKLLKCHHDDFLVRAIKSQILLKKYDQECQKVYKYLWHLSESKDEISSII